MALYTENICNLGRVIILLRLPGIQNISVTTAVTTTVSYELEHKDKYD